MQIIIVKPIDITEHNIDFKIIDVHELAEYAKENFIGIENIEDIINSYFEKRFKEND